MYNLNEKSLLVAVKCSPVWWGIHPQVEQFCECNLLFDSLYKIKLVYRVKSDWEIRYKGKLARRLRGFISTGKKKEVLGSSGCLVLPLGSCQT